MSIPPPRVPFVHCGSVLVASPIHRMIRATVRNGYRGGRDPEHLAFHPTSPLGRFQGCLVLTIPDPEFENL